MRRIKKGICTNRKFIPVCEVNRMFAKLKAYEESELSPEEVHIMSERLTEFELSGLEPSEAKKLADRDKAMPALVKFDSLFCPACGGFFAATKSMARSHPFCWDCGQRIKVDAQE